MSPRRTSVSRRTKRAGAFTIIEVLIASTLGLVVLAAAYSFLYFTLRAISGISAQTVMNQKGAGALELIESRSRLATSMSTDSAGNTLTLGFDDNYNADSDGDGKAYDDRDHYEQFKFIGTNSTNVLACASNQLVYISNTNSTAQRVLIPGGVRNLPGFKIFSTTNTVVTIIRFGIADPKSSDHYQAIDLQGAAVSLNRPWNANTITIIP